MKDMTRISRRNFFDPSKISVVFPAVPGYQPGCQLAGQPRFTNAERR